MRDEDHIGPINGHNKSEALPSGCFAVVLTALAFIAVFGAYGFYADWRKSQPLEECPPFDQCTPPGDWNHPNCKCWESK